MSANTTLRAAETDDVDRVRELVDSSMTSSYALSPGDIQTIQDEEFAEDALHARFEDDDTVALVAEEDGVVAGYVEATVDEGRLQWLHVDPERRGAGVGTTLFEGVVDELRDRDVEAPGALTLAANTSAGAFFERFGFEKAEERQTEFGGLELVEHVYVDGDADVAGTATDAEPDQLDDDHPESVTAEDGSEVYLGDDPIPGTEGQFAEVFSDAARSEQYGYYCTSCGSLDISMDDMERLRCGNCGNMHKPDDYDAAYL